MPARIAVLLQPGGDTTPVPPAHTGPAVNAAFLKALRETGHGDLSSALHETKPPKPYTLTPLVDERYRLADKTSTQVRFEVGVLNEPLTATILQALADTTTLRVARCEYKIAAVEFLGAEPYPELLSCAQPSEQWTVDLLTPTGFFTAREEGARRIRPFPEAEWVFSDLYRRWNTFGFPLDASAAEAITKNLEIVDYQLTMAEHLLKAGAPLGRGSIGTVTYRLADPRRTTPATRAALDALVRFSAYAGIGDRTNIGMGYTLPQM